MVWVILLLVGVVGAWIKHKDGTWFWFWSLIAFLGFLGIANMLGPG